MTVRAIVAGSVVVVLATVAGWLGDAGTAVPLDGGRAVDEIDPVVQAPSAARALVERELAVRAAFPHDAVLVGFAPEFDSASWSPQLVPYGYRLRYAPNDEVGAPDQILSEVRVQTLRTCLDAGTLLAPSDRRTDRTCRRFHLRFALRTTWLYSRWRPRAQRMAEAWWRALFAMRVRAPETLESTCGSPSMLPMERTIGGISDRLRVKRRFDPRALWETVRTAARSRGAFARWGSPYPVLRLAFPPHGAQMIRVREAVVLDEPLVLATERVVLIRTGAPAAGLTDVAAFVSSDNEPMCGPLHIAAATAPPAPRTTPHFEESLANARALDEIRRLSGPNRSQLPFAHTVAYERIARGAIIDVVCGIGSMRWRARFSFDETVPAFRDAVFERLDDRNSGTLTSSLLRRPDTGRRNVPHRRS